MGACAAAGIYTAPLFSSALCRCVHEITGMHPRIPLNGFRMLISIELTRELVYEDLAGRRAGVLARRLERGHT